MSIAFVYFLCYLLISSELLKSTNSKIMLKIKVHDSSAVTLQMTTMSYHTMNFSCKTSHKQEVRKTGKAYIEMAERCTG
jgi:predicted membrane channel-forming protein YqfA (hemolysin III family)